MIVAGIDIGSRASKAVVIRDNEIVSSHIGDTGPESVKSSKMAMESAIKNTGSSMEDVEYIVATGYGRVLVPFASENVSEISCHARGINWFYPDVRTILDMGGQDCKAIRCDEEGNVINFVMNDKCAGGTGRFLEMIAETLNVELNQAGDLALESCNAIAFNTICAVFAKSEALSHLRHGVKKSDVLAGLNEAISMRCLNLLRKVNIEKEFTITGGIAKNKGMVAKISEKVGYNPVLAEDPQIIGALGAALFARDRCTGIKPQGESKIQYGYNDATGDYYITIDQSKCDGCGDCVNICPANIFEIYVKNGNQPKACISEAARNKLSQLCPGSQQCNQVQGNNCSVACKKEAIRLSW